MVLSCEAALEPARLGFTAAGWRTEVDRLPDPGPLAALPARRTVRTPFTAATVPVGLQVAWRERPDAEGAELRWVGAPGERVGVTAPATGDKPAASHSSRASGCTSWPSSSPNQCRRCRRCSSFGPYAASRRAASRPDRPSGAAPRSRSRSSTGSRGSS